MSGIDWGSVFLPSTPPLEIFVRGTITYLALVTLLRLVLNRQSGGYSVTDLLVVVLIADAAQNAMADDYRSVPDGVLLVGTILFWSHTLNWLGYRFPVVERFVHPPPLPIVKEGRMLRRNMRREFITQEELWSQLREQGIERLDDVKFAAVEGDGDISVIRYDAPPRQQRDSEQR